MELGWTFLDPGDEPGQARMRFERLDCAIVAREFCFCQGCVDLVVANLVQQDRGPAFATFQLGDEVVQALLRLWRDWTTTQGTYRGLLHGEHLF